MSVNLQSLSYSDSKTGNSLPYQLFVPDGCSLGGVCGLLLFLHGAGERGCDNQAQLRNDALAFVDPVVQSRQPTIVVYPQCPEGMQWVDSNWEKPTYAIETTPASKPMTTVLALLEEICRDYSVDPRRILVTGLSMGGFGAWDLVLRHPLLFAAALPLCGGGDPTRAEKIRDLPLWAFHGDQDLAVPVAATRSMIKAMRAVGGNPRYTEIAGGGHDVWTHAYRNPEVVGWLLSQSRQR